MKLLFQLYFNMSVIIGGGDRREHHGVSSPPCPMKRKICRPKVKQYNGKEGKNVNKRIKQNNTEWPLNNGEKMEYIGTSKPLCF